MIKHAFSIAFVAFLLSCNINKKQQNQNKAVDVHNSKTSIDWEGSYTGVLPCTDCDGILTTVILKSKMMFDLYETYLGKGDSTNYYSGNFSWFDNGSKVTLVPNNIASPDKLFSTKSFKVGENVLWGFTNTINLKSNKEGEIEKNSFSTKTPLFKHIKPNSEILLSQKWNLIELNKVKTPNIINKHFVEFDSLKVTGNGGCNNFFGSYQSSIHKIKSDNIASTQMYCEGENFEFKFLRLLAAHPTYFFKGDTLIIQSKKNEGVFIPSER